MVDCTCRVTGPDPDDTEFDPACPFHGESGTNVVSVFSRGECVFHYCPHPDQCSESCQSPAAFAPKGRPE